MKWLTAFLAIYLLGLSLWPCADEGLPTTGPESHAVFACAGSESPTDPPHHHDACSPFCSCTCCGAIGIVMPLFEYMAVTGMATGPVAVIYFPYTLPRRAAPFAAIWQPPKYRA